MLMTRNLIFSLIFCCSLSVAHSQDAATDNSRVGQSGEQSQQETQDSVKTVNADGDAKQLSEQKKQLEQQKKLEEQEQQKKKAAANKSKPPKAVFKPTEEISEDSPVPFPVDI
jgi:hypothetical protein